MTITFTFSYIIDMIMAVDGMAASLDRADGNLTVINDDHQEALTQLIKQATAIVTAKGGEVISDYTFTDHELQLTVADSISQSIATSQLTTAVVWQTLQLAYAGPDAARANHCGITVTEAMSTLAQLTLPCPPFRSSHY